MNFNSSRQTGLGLLQQQMLFIQVVFRIEDHTCWFAIVPQVGMQICPRTTSLHITAQNKLVPGQACNEVKAHAEGHHTTARALSLAEPLARPGVDISSVERLATAQRDSTPLMSGSYLVFKKLGCFDVRCKESSSLGRILMRSACVS